MMPTVFKPAAASGRRGPDGHLATVVYGGADLRRTHKLDAAFAPYVLADKLIFVGHRDDKHFVV